MAVEGQRRNRRAGVEDRWKKSDGTPSANAHKGKRWRARYVDDGSRRNCRRRAGGTRRYRIASANARDRYGATYALRQE
ncbi:MAG: hypothetical protein ACLQIK_01775 [Mycobacterium sp.]|jgi:hypothetical protein|uniref:hypothetical protein n=1 Tax=Mycobacterium sp. TaxID=1785 RepID=UPI00283CC175|nr:hypothetical protein [Mycobacterium sp.]